MNIIASCKNIMAVGASQSSGQRIYIGDLGMNYLADFSSRGPTSDGKCIKVNNKKSIEF